MSLIDSVKGYFKSKSQGKEVGKAPEGVCPNCWGKQEWDNEFYKIKKSKDSLPESEVYNSFIKDVVIKLDKITLTKDTYTCETCKVSYDKH
ncbi:MAG: hypothetical protein HKO81_09305 [Flavobacteriaceae bacterium]|nr:hypothetical protein [Flavobacteriaceae bacterium]